MKISLKKWVSMIALCTVIVGVTQGTTITSQVCTSGLGEDGQGCCFTCNECITMGNTASTKDYILTATMKCAKCDLTKCEPYISTQSYNATCTNKIESIF